MTSPDNPKFSIFLPVKNGGAHLHLCVESILSQTFQDFELVILENQSSDGTAEWLQLLDKTEPKVKVLASAADLSIEDNWQRIQGIQKHEFMTIIGHDDLYDNHFLEEINRTIEEQPEATLYLTHFRLIDGDGRLIRNCNPIPKRESAAEFLAARMAKTRDSFGTGYVMRSDQYDKIGGIPPHPDLLYSDDSLWMALMEASFKATSPRFCFSYRFHSHSVSGNPRPESLFAGLKSHLIFLRTSIRDDAEITRVMKEYGRPYVAKACRNYYYYLIKEKPWGKKVDQGKIAEINDVMKEFANQTLVDTTASQLQMIIWHQLVRWGRRFLPLVENALNKK